MVRQPTPEELCDALGRVASSLRQEFPAEYVKVDRHLSRVGRKQSYVTDFKGAVMAMDQLEHYHDVADAHREGAELMAFFAALADQKGDTAAVKQIGHYKDVELQMAALYDDLAKG